MQTAKLIYISIAVLTILPLIVFNIKRFTVRKEGENPRPNIKAIVMVLLASIILGLFLFTHYRFTINYQPQLVLERFINSYSLVISSEIGQDEFFKRVENISTSEFMAEKDKMLEQIRLDSKDRTGSIRFQLGEIIYPKYYLAQDIFPKLDGVKENDRKPIYMLAMLEIDGSREYYILLLDQDESGNRWLINSFNKASQEIIDYASRYNFMKSEYANKWFKVK